MSPRCQVLLRAAELVGDRRALRHMLQVSMSDLCDWLAARSSPPDHVFLKTVDIIEAHAPAQRQVSREQQKHGHSEPY